MVPPRVAPQNSLERQNATAKKSVFTKGLEGVFRTGGIETTTRGKEGRNQEAVSLNNQDSNMLHWPLLPIKRESRILSSSSRA